MTLPLVSLEATSIDDAYAQVHQAVFRHGRIYVVRGYEHVNASGEVELVGGSFIGHRRLELPMLYVRIKYPATLPLVVGVPEGVPPPTDEEAIYNYAGRYLLSNIKAGTEEYTYGTYITQQLPEVIRKLRSQGDGTNQATITIGGVESVHQNDPPCLRLIDFTIRKGFLDMVVYFRSWDGWGGFPLNIAGLQLVKEHVINCLRDPDYCKDTLPVDCNDGEIGAFSKGLHLYDDAWSAAASKLNNVLPEKSAITLMEAHQGFIPEDKLCQICKRIQLSSSCRWCLECGPARFAER